MAYSGSHGVTGYTTTDDQRWSEGDAPHVVRSAGPTGLPDLNPAGRPHHPDHAPPARAAALVARRAVALPLLPHRLGRPGRRRCPRSRRQRLGRDRRAQPLRARPRAALGPPDLHQRRLPDPARPALRAGRQPDRRLPARVRTPRWLGRPGTRPAALRRRRIDRPGQPERRARRCGARRPAAQRVRHHRRPAAGPQRAARARPPVVGQYLCRRPGPVVAAGHLPQRLVDRTPGRRDRRSLDGRRLRPHHRPRHAEPRDHRRGGRLADHAAHRRTGSGARVRVRRRAGRHRLRRGDPLGLRRTAPLHRAGRGQRRERRTAGRLPHRHHRRPRTAGQRPPDPAAWREPPRIRPRPRPDRLSRTRPRRSTADEAAWLQRGAHLALSPAPRLPRAHRRARLLGDRRERPRNPRLRADRLAGQPDRRPGLDRPPARPDAPHRRARQEPPQRDHLVARQRIGHRGQPRGDGRLDPTPRSRASGALRGRPRRRLYRPDQPDVHPGRGARRPERGRRTGRDRDSRAGVPDHRPADHALRVRARDGQRARRGGRLRACLRHPARRDRRLRLGVARPWAAHQAAQRRRFRLRRRLRRDPARCHLRHRRAHPPGRDAQPGHGRGGRELHPDQAAARRRATLGAKPSAQRRQLRSGLRLAARHPRRRAGQRTPRSAGGRGR